MMLIRPRGRSAIRRRFLTLVMILLVEQRARTRGDVLAARQGLLFFRDNRRRAVATNELSRISFRGRAVRAARFFGAGARAFRQSSILTLALGIGANTADFQFWLDATLLRPLPYAEGGPGIVALSEADREGNDLTVSWPDFRGLAERKQEFLGR